MNTVSSLLPCAPVGSRTTENEETTHAGSLDHRCLPHPRGIGKVGKGALADVHPQRLGATVLAAIAERNGLDTNDVDDVVFGTSMQTGTQGGDLGRRAALDAGYPITASGVTLDRFCGSGITAANFATASIMAGPYVGSIPSPSRISAPNPIVNSYPTADGRWLYLVCLQSDRYWLELCGLLERPDLAADARFGDMMARAQNSAECVAELEKTFLSKTLVEWREQLALFTGVWAPALTSGEVHDHAQVGVNGYLPEITGNDGTVFRLPGRPCSSETRRPSRRGQRPSSVNTPKKSGSKPDSIGKRSPSSARVGTSVDAEMNRQIEREDR